VLLHNPQSLLRDHVACVLETLLFLLPSQLEDSQLCHLSALSGLKSLKLDCSPGLTGTGLDAASLPTSLTSVSLKEIAAVA